MTKHPKLLGRLNYIFVKLFFHHCSLVYNRGQLNNEPYMKGISIKKEVDLTLSSNDGPRKPTDENKE